MQVFLKYAKNKVKMFDLLLKIDSFHFLCLNTINHFTFATSVGSHFWGRGLK